MAEVAVSQARVEFGKLLDRVEAGEQIVITRRGKPIARLVRERERSPRDRDAIRRAMEEFREFAKGISTGGMSIKDMIDEGRR